MRLAKGLLTLLLAVLAAPLVAAEAPEMNIEHSIVINAPPEAVWEVVSDFNGLPRWLSTITESRIVLGKNREVGAIRELRRANGTKVQEKLIAYEPWNRSLGYTYIGGQVGATDYFPTMTVSDAGGRARRGAQAGAGRCRDRRLGEAVRGRPGAAMGVGRDARQELLLADRVRRQTLL